MYVALFKIGTWQQADTYERNKLNIWIMGAPALTLTLHYTR